MSSEETPAERREVNVRRAPKYVPFLILGALVGIAADIDFAALGWGLFRRHALSLLPEFLST